MTEFKHAAKLRDLIVKIARNEIRDLSPQPRLGMVQHIDRANNRIQVKFAGDSTLLTVAMTPGNQPQHAADDPTSPDVDMVRIGGRRGNFYLMDVVTSGALNLHYDEQIQQVQEQIEPPPLPAVSPTPATQSVPGAVSVQWEWMSGLTYDLHVTTDENRTTTPPAADTLHTANARPMWVSINANESLLPTEGAWFALVAYNSVDGVAAPSPWVLGVPGQIPEAYAQGILAPSVIARVLQGETISGVNLSGVTLAILGALAAEPGLVSMENADVTAKNLTVLESLDLRGALMQVRTLLQLVGGIGNPTQPPIVTSGGYDLKVSPNGSTGFARRGLTDDPTGANWITTDTVAGNSSVQAFAKSDASGLSNLFNIQPGRVAMGGITRIGNVYYILACASTNGYDYADWQVLKYNATTFAYLGSFAPGARLNTGTKTPAIGTDDNGNLVIASPSPTVGAFYLDTFSTDGVRTARVGPLSGWLNHDMVAVRKTATGFFATRWVIATATYVIVYNVDGVKWSDEEFGLAANDCRGLALTDVWHSLHGGNTFCDYTWLTGPVQIGYAWRDDNAGGLGTTETKATFKSLSPPRFAKWRISVPPPPAAGSTDVDAANAVAVYAGSPLTRQAILPPGVTAVILSAITNTGPVPSPSNGFSTRPATSEGALESSAADNNGPLIRLAPDGSWRLGPLIGNADGTYTDTSA